MAKYTYRLQSLINIKEKLEEQKKNELAVENNKLNQEKQVLTELYQEMSSTLDKQEKEQKQSINAIQLQLYINYTDKLKIEIKQQLDKVEKQEKKTEEVRLELLEYTKAKKSLEKLKEKDYENYLEEEKRAEQKLVDEIVSYKYNSKE